MASMDGVLSEDRRQLARHARPCSSWEARIPEGEQSTLTLTASEGVAVAGTLTDAVIVPLQCEGWARYSESPDDIRKAFANAGFADRVRWLEPGRRSEMCNER